MFDGFKRSWRLLKRSQPGLRFQEQYEAQQRSRRPAWARPVWIAAGTAIMAIGVVALPAPGPGILVIALGAAMFARESRTAARVLDWIELRLHAAWTWARRLWERARWPARAIIVLFGMALALAFGWMASKYVLEHWFA